MAGKNLELSCIAEAALGMKVEYCWFKCRKKDGTGKKPTDYSGSRMVLPACNDANTGHYLCEASVITEQGIPVRISSRVAHVKVVNPTAISIVKQPPSEMLVSFGVNLSLEFEAFCKHHTVKYQWYKEAEPLIGATQSTLNITAVHEDNVVGSYHCEATSEFSEDRIKSRRTLIKSK